ncbi:VOC family protein [Ruicaihuangia caeni]|uniref:VOC family protein n=1 Tax=Ruicaihuangia caeni TaxID=3042517 RepID=UPI00338E1334
MNAMQKITPCLWFNEEAEQAAMFYCSVFREGRVLSVSRYGPDDRMPEGTALVVEFELAGQRFQALNGGTDFPFTEAISLSIETADQAETDYYWEALTAGGGAPGPCGWLKDRFGLSWQVVPKAYVDLISTSDSAAVARINAALYTMQKIVIADLVAARDGEAAGDAVGDPR